MAGHIDKQNEDLKKFVKNNQSSMMYDNVELCEKLGIEVPLQLHIQNYAANDIRVYLHQTVA
jgi:hypothetical protein